MKGYRFYLEYSDSKAKRRSGKGASGEHKGTVIAVDPDGFWGGHAYIHEAVGAVLDYPNSPVATTGCVPEYLREQCKRISETEARRIHPELFRFLD
jgi:hypothetical protein